MAESELTERIKRLEPIVAEIKAMPECGVSLAMMLDDLVTDLKTAEKQADCPHLNTQDSTDDFRYGFIEYTDCLDCGKNLKYSRIT